MTNEQQLRLTKRIVTKRKQNELKIPDRYDNRGRELKYEQFPEMSKIIESIFEGGSMDHYTGGGLESYPRLTTFTRYRSVDNVTSMHQARKILLLTFRFHCAITTRRITEKRGSLHHARKYINANISLRLPPRDLVVDNKQVVNLHWSTCSVNYLMNTVGAQPNSFIVDSKDAERIVLAET